MNLTNDATRSNATRPPARRLWLLAPLMAALFAIAQPFAARAESLEFCDAADKACVAGGAYNAAAVTVTKVTIRQKPDDTRGCADVTRVRGKNLAGGFGKIGGFADTLFNKACDYHVHFKTTDGCTGDKDITLTSDDIKNGKSTAKLKGGCGTLDTAKTLGGMSY